MDVLVDAINKYSVGLDDTFTRLHAFGLNPQSSSYPPYNIQKLNDNEWKIELGLAGWSKEEVEVSTKEKQLHITSIKERPSEGNDEFLHRGLAARSFDRTFNLSEDVEVSSVTFCNGLLTISLERIIPEAQQKKVYEIT
tara:strand:+ start:541 stop:957 length:417 start_codon:yes stop_codon:yes gene_type:complete